MLLPRAFDGGELEPGAYLATIEAIARCDASMAWDLFVANSAALIAPHLEPETARTIFQRTGRIGGLGTTKCDRMG